jgi:hypothetical protein
MGESVSGRIIMCQNTGFGSCPFGRRAAVTVITPSGAFLACCDASAHRYPQAAVIFGAGNRGHAPPGWLRRA